MHIIHTIEALRQWRQTVGRVAFVPTMGNLHAGHLSLVARAKEEASQVVVSIFVNRIQFGAGEDFERYPRTLDADVAKLREAGVSVVFAPDENELYPFGTQSYFVEPPAIQHELCGAFRPGHFRGVVTVVNKLFNIVQPDVAVFGEKDFQQLAVIRSMVHELNMAVRVIGMPTARTEHGLALSSRNQYLSPAEQEQAIDLYQQLNQIKNSLLSGSQDFSALEHAAGDYLYARGWRVDYIAIRDARSLKAPQADSKNLVILGAAHLGKTRLIDNLTLTLP